MRDLFPGWHRLNDAEVDRTWDTGLIVLDASVLLGLYRMSEAARGQLLELMANYRGRLFVPHHAAFEFQTSRIGVIEEQRRQYARIRTRVLKLPPEVESAVRLNSPIDRAELRAMLDTALGPVLDHLDQLEKAHPDPLAPGGDWIGADAVRDALSAVVGAAGFGRPGPELDLKEAARRYKESIPPGYRDKVKPEATRYGDLIVWLELIERARAESKPALLVTDDLKEDWWLLQEGRRIGPLSRAIVFGR